MKNIVYLLFSIVFVGSCFLMAFAQLPSQDPGHKQGAEISGVKFSVPNGFNLQQSAGSRVAFMRHNKYDLALFVTVPDTQIDSAYLGSLSNTLVSLLFPNEKDFRWKMLPTDSANKVSDFQVATGNTKGFNGKRLFQTDYISVKIKDREILVGYITQLGQFNNDAKYLFDLKGVAGMSMPGWYAQAHIIASVTGEKYERINPGTSIIATPLKKP